LCGHYTPGTRLQGTREEKRDFSLRSPTAQREVGREEKASGCFGRNDGAGASGWLEAELGLGVDELLATVDVEGGAG
jgi:hypothetical protein